MKLESFYIAFAIGFYYIIFKPDSQEFDDDLKAISTLCSIV